MCPALCGKGRRQSGAFSPHFPCALRRALDCDFLIGSCRNRGGVVYAAVVTAGVAQDAAAAVNVVAAGVIEKANVTAKEINVGATKTCAARFARPVPLRQEQIRIGAGLKPSVLGLPVLRRTLPLTQRLTRDLRPF